MALRSAASLQRVLSNGDDDGMFWDYGQAAGLRTGICVCCTPPHAHPCHVWSPVMKSHPWDAKPLVSCVSTKNQSTLVCYVVTLHCW